MASTPPPLPSSSEDSDFDDDFGCFSSAPVRATNKIEANPIEETSSDANESFDAYKESSEDNSLGAESEIVNGSDKIVTASDKSENLKPEEKEVSTELFASDKFCEADVSDSSYVVTSESTQIEEQDDINSDLSHSSNSNRADTPDNTTDYKSDKDVDLQAKSESDEHSATGDADQNDSVKLCENDNSTLSVADDKITNHGISSGGNDNFIQAKIDVGDAKELVDPPCEGNVENPPCEGNVEDEEDFGDWSDMQTFQSNEVVDDEASEAQNKSLKNEDNQSNTSETQNDRAAMDEKENNETFHDSPPSSQSPCHDSENIPLDMSQTTGETGDNQDSNSPADNDNDFGNGDEDGFGDFADFSSHQVNEHDNGENIVPLSFKTNGSDGSEEEKASEDNNDGQADVCDTVKCDSNLENADSVKDNVEDDFDDDDWGFKSAETNDNESDDFGNFGSVDNGNGDSDWASFNDAAPTQAATVDDGDNDDDDDDFNDFNESDFQAPTVPQSEPISSKIQESASKVEKVVFMCFPDIISRDNQTSQKQNSCDKSKTNVEGGEIDNLCSVVEMGLKVTPKAKEETWTIVKELRNKDPVVGTWGRLKDVNSSHALDYAWSSSHCCQEIFSTLHIDTKNVLFSQKKQAVPFYASGLGILEPIRGGPNPAEKAQPAIAPTPALLDTTSKPEETKKSLDIPPVDFDWGSSGLTNPLKVFKNDSFNNGLTSLEPFSDVLHKNIEPTKELSKEAKSILSKIPNLNFMRSNVLMFPIKD